MALQNESNMSYYFCAIAMQYQDYFCKISWKHTESLHKKWSFPLRISSANVTKSAVYFGFGHIYSFTEEIFNGKLHFLCSVSQEIDKHTENVLPLPKTKKKL